MRFFTTFLLIILLIGCSNSRLNINDINDDDINVKYWNYKQILEKLDGSQNKNGGFNLLIEEKKESLYESYYTIKILENSGITIPRKEMIIKEIEHYFSNDLEIDTFGKLEEVGFLTGIGKSLGWHDENIKNKIISPVLDLVNTENGWFEISNDDDILTKISTTELSIKIFENVGYKYNDIDDKLLTRIVSLYSKNSIETLSEKFPWSIYSSLIYIEKHIKDKDILFYNQSKNKKYKDTLISKSKNYLQMVPKNKIELLNHVNIVKIHNSLGIYSNIGESLLQYINSIKLDDGGFNLLDSDILETQSTYLLYSCFYDKIPPELVSDLLKYQLNNGLFTPRFELPSDLMKTYMAAEVYQNLGHENTKIYDFIMNDLGELEDSKSIHYFNKIRKLLKIDKFIEEDLDLNHIAYSIDSNTLYSFYNYVFFNRNKEKKVENIIKEKIYALLLDSKSKLSNPELFMIYEILFELKANMNYWDNYVKDNIVVSTIPKGLADLYYFSFFLIKVDCMKKQNYSGITERLRQLKLDDGGYKENFSSVTSSIKSLFFGIKLETLLKEYSRSNENT